MFFADKVVYQIYPYSFYDSNNDGVGDIQGIIMKLDYLKSLNIDYIWITPMFKSPQHDNGYDISDYYAIDSRFGTISDVEQLINECDQRSIGVIFDMVLNHTSTFHPWFEKALQGEKRYQDYYFFKKTNDLTLPTNWKSKMGGAAWEYVEHLDLYYLHVFSKYQADLNWENDEVKNELYKIVKFWIEKGIKGIRFDVINLISKPVIFENEENLQEDGRRFYTDGPKVHQYIKQLHQNSFADCENFLTVGEISSSSLNHCIKYGSLNNEELSMVFDFHHLKVDYEQGYKWVSRKFVFQKMQEVFKHWQEGMCQNNAWLALFLNNHDQPRSVTRFGDDKKYWYHSATALALFTHFLRGTPFIYQGEEIGMTNFTFNKYEYFQDVETKGMWNVLLKQNISESEILKIMNEKSREHSRSPMQWNDTKFAGFSKVRSWMKVNDNYKLINVNSQINDSSSILSFYKQLIRCRKTNETVQKGDILFVNDNDYVMQYYRNYKSEKLLVLVNFYAQQVVLKLLDKNHKGILINNYDQVEINENNEIILKPYQGVVFLYEIEKNKVD